MKKLIVGVTLVALITLSACSGGPAGAPAAPEAVPMTAVKASGQIEAEARVVPVHWTALSFQRGGSVQAVNVQVGDAVKAGDVLAQLDAADAQLSVAQAEAGLAQAQAQLAQLNAGPQPAQVAIAEQALRQAEAGEWNASAQLAQVLARPTAADIALAEAGVIEAAAREKQLQDDYNKLIKAFQDHGVGGGTPEEQLRAALEAARQAHSAAQSRLDQLKAGASQAEIDFARANLAIAQAQKGQAQAKLAQVQAAPTAEAIALAKAGLKQAQLSLESARAQLAKLQLVAPFDGAVASLDLKPGELVTAGAPVARVADLTAWQIETDDLTELYIARVHEGSPATITFDAIPALELAGRVVRVRAMGEKKQGDVTYVVTIAPDRHDERLRWNMTAYVAITPGQPQAPNG